MSAWSVINYVNNKPLFIRTPKTVHIPLLFCVLTSGRVCHNMLRKIITHVQILQRRGINSNLIHSRSTEIVFSHYLGKQNYPLDTLTFGRSRAIIDGHGIVLIDWDKSLHGLRPVTNQCYFIEFFFKVSCFRFQSFQDIPLLLRLLNSIVKGYLLYTWKCSPSF